MGQQVHAAALSVAALLDALKAIMAIPDLEAACHFGSRHHALDLVAQLMSAPGVSLHELFQYQSRLLWADQLLYSHIAEGIYSGRLRGPRLRRLLEHYSDTVPAQAGTRFLSYDLADALWGGVCEHAMAPTANLWETGMVHLEHTPVRVVLALLDRWPAERDSGAGLIDVGCGLGQVTHLVGALTDLRVRGFDVEPQYVAHAKVTAGRLGLQKVDLCTGDARQADYAGADVVFMFTPCVGAMLRGVLDRIRDQREGDRFWIASYGASSLALAQETWLEPADDSRADPFCLCLFQSR